MSRIFGIGTSDIVAQPGFTATESQEGGWTGSHSFMIRRTAWNSEFVRNQFAVGREITLIDPNLSTFFSFLKIASINVTSDEGDFILVQTSLAGAGGGSAGQYGADGAIRPVYRLTCSLQDAPLSDHPKWKTFTAIEKEALSGMISGDLVFDEPSDGVGTRDERSFWLESNSNGDPFTLTTLDAIEFAKIIAAGQTTYQKPAMVWTESTQGTAGLSFDQIQKLGKIDTPGGNPPEPSGVRDWMLIGAFDEETGGLHRTELEWTMSEAGGFNETLYKE